MKYIVLENPRNNQTAYGEDKQFEDYYENLARWLEFESTKKNYELFKKMFYSKEETKKVLRKVFQKESSLRKAEFETRASDLLYKLTKSARYGDLIDLGKRWQLISELREAPPFMVLRHF